MLVILAWLMFSLHVIFSDSAGNFDSNTPCGKNNPVANICQFSEIANTSIAFVYILNSPGQNKRTCTCSLSPTSPNVRIILRYRELTRSTENINLKIYDFEFGTKHTDITTVLSERKELVLNTNPVFNNSEKVCILIKTEEDRRFNISCDYPTSDSTDSDTKIVGYIDPNYPCGQTTQVANICQFSEIVNTSKVFVYILNSPGQNKRTCTCSLSPTSPNVRIFLRYRNQTRSTENINLKINDFEFSTNHTDITTVLTERKELILETNPVFNNSEKVCLLIKAVEEDRRFNISCDYPTSEGTDSDTKIVGHFDSNNRCGNTTSVANICQFSEIVNTSKVFVYILNSPGQNKRTCTCSLSPTSPNVRIFLRYRNQTRSTENINLKINDFVFSTNHTDITTVLTERKELILETNPVFNNSEKVCLLITAVGKDRRFNISCVYPTSDGTDSDTNIVGVAIGGALAGVIAIVMVVLSIVIVFLKRHRSAKEKRSNQSNEVTMSDLEPNIEQSKCVTNTCEIPDQNVYEGLDRQGNAPSSELYQHLYTETNNPDCESKNQNLSHRHSDTNSLEKEHNNTPDKDSICDSIHRENSSNEYERYKANATDHMYETLQKDK